MANRLIIRRLLCERSERRRWDESRHQFRTRHGLQEAIKAFNLRLTAVQRVLSRFDNLKVLNSLTIEIDKAKSLRGIAASLVGIHDTLRYLVGFLATTYDFPVRLGSKTDVCGWCRWAATKPSLVAYTKNHIDYLPTKPGLDFMILAPSTATALESCCEKATSSERKVSDKKT